MSTGSIGYFGGTFDPPHLGHIILASETRYQLGLDLIRWIITPDPPHKVNKTISPLQHRMEMLKLVVIQDQGFEISEIDLHRPPPHYAADTVERSQRRRRRSCFFPASPRRSGCAPWRHRRSAHRTAG